LWVRIQADRGCGLAQLSDLPKCIAHLIKPRNTFIPYAERFADDFPDCAGKTIGWHNAGFAMLSTHQAPGKMIHAEMRSTRN